jgi:oligopeptide transport system substrate-binding protein
MRHLARCLVFLILILAVAACRDTAEAPEVVAEPMVLDYNFVSDPTTLDPALAVDTASLNVVRQLFDGLTAFDPATAEVVPGLAVAWDVSQNGFTYTFRLREGAALWVNQRGEPQGEVLAEDVVYSIKRACAPETASPSAYLLFIISGCEEAYTAVGIPDLDSIAVRAIDRFTVEFTLVRPAAHFPAILGMPVAFPVPAAAVDSYGTTWTEPQNLITNGAYLLAEWRPGERLTLDRNPVYYDAASVSLVRVNGTIAPDPTTALTLYQQNGLDSMRVPPEIAEWVLADEALRGQLTQAPDPCTYAYGFTLVKPPLDNARVRRALSLAIDRPYITGQVLGRMHTPAYHFAPPGTFGVPPRETQGIETDVGAAQELMVAAGYPGGAGFPPITLMAPAGEPHAAIAAAVSSGWSRDLGIQVSVVEQAEEQYEAAIDGTVPLNEAPHVWVLSWCADYPDEHNWLSEVFALNQSSGAPRMVGSRFADRVTIVPGENSTRRIPGRLDELTAQAASEQDPELRRDLYAQAEQTLILDEAMIAPIFHQTVLVLTKPWLDRDYLSIAGQSFKGWTVDMSAKHEARGEATATPPPSE